MNEPLPGLEVNELQVPVTQMSTWERLRRLQLLNLRNGLHPLTVLTDESLRLHPQAPAVDNVKAAGPRCGSCVFRVPVIDGSKSYPKCAYTPPGAPKARPRVTRTAPSTVAAWWPACPSWQQKGGHGA